MPKLLLTGAASWILGGKIHSGRATKALQKKHKKEQKNLYTQYYNDVYSFDLTDSQWTRLHPGGDGASGRLLPSAREFPQ